MKKMLPVACLVLALLLYGCNEQDVLYDMARFDRTYVPAMVLTGTKDTTGQSVLAVKRLRQDWDLLSAKYRQLFVVGDSAGKVSGIIERADLLITTGDFQGAHRELESISGILLDVRKRSGIDYYMDYLNRFYSTMEKTLSTVLAKEPDNVTESDLASIAAMLPRAREQWSNVSTARFDRKPFLFDKQTEKALMDAVVAEARAIENLEAALRSGNRKLIFRYSGQLREGFFSVYRMFGNFDSVSI